MLTNLGNMHKVQHSKKQNFQKFSTTTNYQLRSRIYVIFLIFYTRTLKKSFKWVFISFLLQHQNCELSMKQKNTELTWQIQ